MLMDSRLPAVMNEQMNTHTQPSLLLSLTQQSMQSQDKTHTSPLEVPGFLRQDVT